MFTKKISFLPKHRNFSPTNIINNKKKPKKFSHRVEFHSTKYHVIKKKSYGNTLTTLRITNLFLPKDFTVYEKEKRCILVAKSLIEINARQPVSKNSRSKWFSFFALTPVAYAYMYIYIYTHHTHLYIYIHVSIYIYYVPCIYAWFAYIHGSVHDIARAFISPWTMVAYKLPNFLGKRKKK